jgi:hypothetical protein
MYNLSLIVEISLGKLKKNCVCCSQGYSRPSNAICSVLVQDVLGIAVKGLIKDIITSLIIICKFQ